MCRFSPVRRLFTESPSSISTQKQVKVFRNLRKKVGKLIDGIKSLVSSAEPENAASQVKEKSKNKRPARAKDPSYVRAADRREPPRRTEKPQENQRGALKPQKSGKKSKAPQERKPSVPNARIVPPVPELVPPPEEPGKLRFFDLELAPEILAATADLGFKYCTEIQARCLPYALAGRDLAAKAQTGTGKTAAFLASTMTRILRKPAAVREHGTCRVLVLSPTRELAMQIHQDAENLAKYTSLNNLVIFGGMDHKGQRDALEKPVDVLVGTPGRILDYCQSGHLDLSKTETLVIDEADRMLDMGFIPDVRRIVSKLPPPGKRETMLFSATLEDAILRLVAGWLNDPVTVESEPEKLVTDLIEQKFYAVLEEQKLPFLLNFIATEKPGRLIIFGNRKHKNRTLVKKMYAYGIDAELLSGDIAQTKRIKILDDFREGRCNVLVATDVAARGIHVDGITHVVNYDLPDQADDYVHRIGRTGRAGAKGQSISFVCEVGAFSLPAIEEYVKIKVKTVQPPAEMLVMPRKTRRELYMPDEDFAPRRENHRGGGGGGRRPPSRGRSSSCRPRGR